MFRADSIIGSSFTGRELRKMEKEDRVRQAEERAREAREEPVRRRTVELCREFQRVYGKSIEILQKLLRDQLMDSASSV